MSKLCLVLVLALGLPFELRAQPTARPSARALWRNAGGRENPTITKQFSRIDRMEHVYATSDSVVGVSASGLRRSVHLTGFGEAEAITTTPDGVSVTRRNYSGNPYEVVRQKEDPGRTMTTVFIKGIVIGPKRLPGSVRRVLDDRTREVALPMKRQPKAGDRVYINSWLTGKTDVHVLADPRPKGTFDAVMSTTR